MKPPRSLDVIDDHGGFTAETKLRGYNRRRPGWEMGDPGEATTWYQPTQTVWRPGKLLKKTVEGELLTFDERSFYQTNNDVTKALYKVKGYNHPVVIWFDNATGERLDRRSKQTKTAWTR